MSDFLEEIAAKKQANQKRFDEHDHDTCMLCQTNGSDMRSLFIDCFYAVDEVIPEVIDLGHVETLPLSNHKNGFYLRICKNCRASMLGHLGVWRTEMIARRELDKDSDGNDAEPFDPNANIPVRVNGTTVMMTLEQYQAHKQPPVAPALQIGQPEHTFIAGIMQQNVTLNHAKPAFAGSKSECEAWVRDESARREAEGYRVVNDVILPPNSVGGYGTIFNDAFFIEPMYKLLEVGWNESDLERWTKGT